MSDSAPMPGLPLLKPWYRLATTPEGMLLEHGRSSVFFGGAAATRLLPVLLPLLDGERTTDEIVAVVGRPAEPAVRNALTLLAAHGLLTDGPPLRHDLASGLRRTATYLAQSAPDPPTRIAERLARARVLLEGDDELAGAVGRLLRRSGVARSTGNDSTFVATAGAVAGDPLLESRNAVALDTGAAWLPYGCFDGRIATIGPLIVPHETACYRCLSLRRDGSAACAAELRSLRSVPLNARNGPALAALVAAIAAERIVRWIGVRDPSLPGAVVSVETVPELTVSNERLLRVPRCPACSSLAGIGQPVPWHEAAWETA